MFSTVVVVVVVVCCCHCLTATVNLTELEPISAQQQLTVPSTLLLRWEQIPGSGIPQVKVITISYFYCCEFAAAAALALLSLDWEEQGSVCLTRPPKLSKNGPKLTELRPFARSNARTVLTA